MRASPEEESSNESGLDDVLKAIGLPQYGKAFSQTEGLEWLLKLRSLFLIRLALALRELVVLDEDGDSQHKIARHVLTLAAEVAARQSLCDGLTSLDQSLLSSPGSDARRIRHAPTSSKLGPPCSNVRQKSKSLAPKHWPAASASGTNTDRPCSCN